MLTPFCVFITRDWNEWFQSLVKERIEGKGPEEEVAILDASKMTFTATSSSGLWTLYETGQNAHVRKINGTWSKEQVQTHSQNKERFTSSYPCKKNQEH